MSLIIPPGFAQAVHVLRLSGDPEDMVTTMGFEVTIGSGGGLTDAANLAFQAFGANFMPYLPSDYSLREVVLYSGNDGPTIVTPSTDTPVVGGGAAGSALPPNTALLVRKRTDLAGRRGRGRMYIPGIGRSNVSTLGVVDGTSLAAWQTAADNYYDDLVAGVGGTSLQPVVLHRSEGIGDEPPPTPITTLEVDSRVATQRGRLRP